jgi:predicted ATPase
VLSILSIANYRSIRQMALPLGRLNVVTGANGSGKSNLYRELRLLSDTARGGIIGRYWGTTIYLPIYGQI